MWHSHSPSKIFLTLGVLSALQSGMALFFALAIHGVSEMTASCYRVEEFLRLPERPEVAVSNGADPKAGAVLVEHVTCAWTPERVALKVGKSD